MTTIRSLVFTNEEVYHVFNRGVEKRPIFTSKHDYKRMVETVQYYQYTHSSVRFSHYLLMPQIDKLNYMQKYNKLIKKQVSIMAYCLMPNHFHLILKQLQDGGITRFTANVTNSFTKYFNIKNRRVGPLVQGTFKAVHVETDEQLVHLSRYIHLNPFTGFLVKLNKLESYLWSSYSEYLGQNSVKICDTLWLKEFFSNTGSYKHFVNDQAEYARELEKIKHLSFDV